MALLAQAAPPQNTAAPVGTAQKSMDFIERIPEEVFRWVVAKGPSLAAALVILFIAWVLGRWAKSAVLRAFRRARIDDTLGKFFGNVARWAVLVMAVTVAMQAVDIPVTPFATVIGAAGLAIGLALQGNLSNLACGVLLLVFRPFKVGDAVIVAGQTGTVESIDLFTSNLDTVDNRRIIVPNAAIFGGVIENQTQNDRRCVVVHVPAAAAADLDATKSLLEQAAQRVQQKKIGAIVEQKPAVALAELSPAVTWSVALWVETPRFAEVKTNLLREIKLAMDAAGFTPGAPVMNVNIREMPARA